MRMITLRTHTRGDTLLKPGDEFDATEEEMHAYASRANPLAGPLDDEDGASTPAPAATKRAAKKAPAKATRAAPAPTKKGAKK